MVPDINYLAVLVAVIASMVIGLVFYHRAVFGRTRISLVGLTDETVQGGSPLVYPVVVVAAFSPRGCWRAPRSSRSSSTGAASWCRRW